MTVDGMASDHVPESGVLEIRISASDAQQQRQQKTALLVRQLVLDFQVAIPARIRVPLLNISPGDPGILDLGMWQRADLLRLMPIDVDECLPRFAEQLCRFFV